MAFSIPMAIVVCLAYVIIDALYAYYTIKVTTGHAVASATTSSIMHGMLALGAVVYTQSPLYIVPLAIGSWAGTFLVVKFKDKIG